MFLRINKIEAMELKPGDQVKCTHSRVTRRIGSIFTVIRKRPNNDQFFNNEVNKDYLNFLHTYGDQFEKIN